MKSNVARLNSRLVRGTCRLPSEDIDALCPMLYVQTQLIKNWIFMKADPVSRQNTQ